MLAAVELGEPVPVLLVGPVEEVQLERKLQARKEILQSPRGVVVHVCGLSRLELFILDITESDSN
jgi:hypothetical protein